MSPKDQKREEIIIWLNPTLSKIESWISIRRQQNKTPVQLCCLKTRGLNLGVPEFSFERNEMVNALIKKKGNGWAERKGIAPRLFNVLRQTEKWFTPRLYSPDRETAHLFFPFNGIYWLCTRLCTSLPSFFFPKMIGCTDGKPRLNLKESAVASVCAQNYLSTVMDLWHVLLIWWTYQNSYCHIFEYLFKKISDYWDHRMLHPHRVLQLNICYCSEIWNLCFSF